MADFTMRSKEGNTYVKIVRLKNGDILTPIDVLDEPKDRTIP